MMFKFFKGIFIGMSNVIPGLCSATVSLILNMYDELLDCISNVFNIHKWRRYLYLYFSIFIGIIVGILLLNSLYKVIPFIMNMCFLGLLIRTFPVHITQNKIKCNYPILIVGIIIVLGMGCINVDKMTINNINIDYSSVLYIVLNGFFSSFAMILPGLSGALMLVVTGIYFPLLNSINQIIISVLTFSSLNINDIIFVLIFVVSFIIGLVVSSKIVKRLINNHQVLSYNLINGMILGSLINLLFNSISIYPNIVELIFGIMLLITIYLFPTKKK